MSDGKEGGGKMTIRSPGDTLGRRISRFCWTVVILAAVVLAAGAFGVRTQAVRSALEDRLTRLLGMKVSLERARIGLPYVLVLEDMVSENFGASDKSWFRAEEVRIGLERTLRPTVSVRRALLSVYEDDRQPALAEVLGRLARLDLQKTEEISKLTARFRNRMRLEVTDGAIRWHREGGKEAGSAVGINLRVFPVRMPGRDLYYHRLSVYRLETGEVTLSELEKEWLASENGEDVLIPKPGSRVAAPPPPPAEDADRAPEAPPARRRWRERDPGGTE